MAKIICKLTYYTFSTIDKTTDKHNDYIFSITNINRYENQDHNIYFDIKTIYLPVTDKTEIGEINNDFFIDDYHIQSKFIANIEFIKPFWKKIPIQIQLYLQDWKKNKQQQYQPEPEWIKTYVKHMIESKESEKSKILYD